MQTGLLQVETIGHIEVGSYCCRKGVKVEATEACRWGFAIMYVHTVSEYQVPRYCMECRDTLELKAKEAPDLWKQ